QQIGYVRNQKNGPYFQKGMPPLTLGYTEAVVDPVVHVIDAQSVANIPSGLDGRNYQWVDLDSEGISGILTEQADAWFYKRNLGEGRFSPIELVATKPSSSDLHEGQQQLIDLAGDGHKYLVQYSGPLKGSYQHMEGQQWEGFTPFLFSPD